MSNRRSIYLDNAASTPLNTKVAQEMARALKLYGNPSSYNDCGREAREYIECARSTVARFVGAHSDEIIFTSSGTEANNLAIFGIANCTNRGEIISTPIEHPSVLRPLEFLKRRGRKVIFVKVNREGLVDVNDLKKKLTHRTVLVSVMYANNEIGTIQPIREISKIIKDFRKALEIRNSKLGIHEKMCPFFHTDACQATEYMDMNVNHLGVDLLTFNGSKIYGPKGVGVLYKRRGVSLLPVLLGGEQEFGLRAGTENIEAIGGLSAALDQIDKSESKRLTVLRDHFIEKVNDLLPDIAINGPFFAKASKGKAQGDNRMPNNINISVPGLSSEVLLLELDKYGICAGSGSACTSHSIEPSHVLKAIGVDGKYLDGAVRFSMGRQTTKKDIDYVLRVLPKAVRGLKKRYKKI